MTSFCCNKNEARILPSSSLGFKQNNLYPDLSFIHLVLEGGVDTRTKQIGNRGHGYKLLVMLARQVEYLATHHLICLMQYAFCFPYYRDNLC